MTRQGGEVQSRRGEMESSRFCSIRILDEAVIGKRILTWKAYRRSMAGSYKAEGKRTTHKLPLSDSKTGGRKTETQMLLQPQETHTTDRICGLLKRKNTCITENEGPWWRVSLTKNEWAVWSGQSSEGGKAARWGKNLRQPFPGRGRAEQREDSAIQILGYAFNSNDAQLLGLMDTLKDCWACLTPK